MEIRYFARVEWDCVIKDWGVAQALAPHHIWQESEIEARFNYDKISELSLHCVARVKALCERLSLTLDDMHTTRRANNRTQMPPTHPLSSRAHLPHYQCRRVLKAVTQFETKYSKFAEGRI